MWICGFNRINKIYDRCNDGKKGAEFCENLIKYFNIKFDIDPSQFDYIPQDGSFITISNHPYGGIDGILLMLVVGSMRNDFKILTNFILSMIPSLRDTFLPVNPFTNNEIPGGNIQSLSGLRSALNHVSSGGGLGLFPAGEVSTYQKGEKKVAVKKHVSEDIKWPLNMVKLIKNADVPVIPVYFDGENSKLFHYLGKIHPMLRTISLAREVANKRGRVIKMSIGKPITHSELSEYTTLEDLGDYMRNRVYALEGEISNQNKNLNIVADSIPPIAIPKNKKAVLKEIDKLKPYKLFDSASYQCFLAPCEVIPNVLHEIGRRREEAFRATGEGVNKPLDLDEYDSYYKHLILWDKNRKKIAGAYRLGIGEEIFEKYGGIGGFYSSCLFKYKEKFGETLQQTIELGRSFVSLEYQKESLPLLLLIKGLMYSLMQYPNVRYFIGPVSISNWYPRFYQSLMVFYLKEKHKSSYGKEYVTPRTPFSPDFLRVNPVGLLKKKMDSFERFDRFLLRISDNKYRMPTLVKKYIKINSKLICYNIDPSFNYCLDGLIILDLKDFPKSELLMMTKDIDNISKEKILNRFGHSLKEPDHTQIPPRDDSVISA